MGSDPEPGLRSTPAWVLIADDHELVRDGFKRMLGYEEDLELVGEASNGREAVELCRRLNPDLVLMDVRMPGMDGLEATRAIKGELPEVSVLIVTTHESQEYLLEAIRAGVSGGGHSVQDSLLWLCVSHTGTLLACVVERTVPATSRVRRPSTSDMVLPTVGRSRV